MEHPVNEHAREEAIRADERARCKLVIEEYAVVYVNKWVNLQGDTAKAQGWAILQAAHELKPLSLITLTGL